MSAKCFTQSRAGRPWRGRPQHQLPFSAYDDPRFVWAYPDLTIQCEYLGHVIREALEQELESEARYRRDLHRTRGRIKGIIEAPDLEVDRWIRAIRENDGRISGKLRAEVPIIEEPEFAAEMIAAIRGDAQ